MINLSTNETQKLKALFTTLTFLFQENRDKKLKKQLVVLVTYKHIIAICLPLQGDASGEESTARIMIPSSREYTGEIII